MGAVIGLGFGTGLLMVFWAVVHPRVTAPDLARRPSRLAALIARSGIQGLRRRHVIAAAVASWFFASVTVLAVTRVAAVAAVVGVVAAVAPIGALRARAAARARAHAAVWPDVVDNLASAVRAGLSLPEAVVQLGDRGPEALREPFAAFGRDYGASGRFHECLDLLKARLADPVGDRVVEALRIARDVGGGDLGRMLRSLSSFLREDLRTRGELESRQSWTVNGARLAVAAPWLVLMFMSLQADTMRRYASPAGLVVLGSGAAVSVVAYRLMMWIGRFPAEPRYLA